MLFCNIQMPIYFYTIFFYFWSRILESHPWFDVLQKEDELVFIGFWQTFFNYLQIGSKYSKTVFSVCKICLRKMSCAKSRWRWSNALCPNANGIEKSDICWQKISNLVQFNNKKHLLQCKVKYNDETIKI